MQKDTCTEVSSMSKLNIDQKTIKLLLTDKHSDFLIPDYQRPYAWGEDECATLWDDLFTFAFPNDDCDAFESTSDEYFLGPIVTFKNDAGQLEIIDGQQRLTTIMLLLRAFYDKFANMKDKQSIKVRDSIAGCVWKTDEFDDPDMDALKIDSEVASDSDKDEFLDILRHAPWVPCPTAPIHAISPSSLKEWPKWQASGQATSRYSPLAFSIT